MRTVFEILPDNVYGENCSLLCEVSNEGFSYCIKEETTNSFTGLAIYHYDKSKPLVGFPIALQILFHQKEILSRKFRKVAVVYSIPQSVLIPFPMYEREKNADVMNLMHGDLYANETILTDVISGHSFYNCYRIRTPLYEAFQHQFPHAESFHQYSLLFNNPGMEKDRLLVIFYTRKVIVSLVKDGKFLLINSYNYRTPEDVSYLLLNLIQQFQIQGILIEIRGLLEENSALYREIYKYFTDIELSKLPPGVGYSEEILKYPSHYFSHIFANNSCASLQENTEGEK